MTRTYCDKCEGELGEILINRVYHQDKEKCLTADLCHSCREKLVEVLKTFGFK